MRKSRFNTKQVLGFINRLGAGMVVAAERRSSKSGERVAEHGRRQDAAFGSVGARKQSAFALGQSAVGHRSAADRLGDKVLVDQDGKIAFANGARAAKVSGAGGGGFMMFLCDPEQRVGLIRALQVEGGNTLDFHFTQQGATWWRIA